MSETAFTLPAACTEAARAIEADPLELPAAVQAHLAECPACAEARVLWLAQDDAAPALAPAGYFDRLPDRILGKLPAPRRVPLRRPAWLAAAAALMALTAAGGFWAGRMNRQPLEEASIKHAPAELRDVQAEQPFHDRYEVIEQFQSLSPEEARALLEQLETKEPGTKP